MGPLIRIQRALSLSLSRSHKNECCQKEKGKEEKKILEWRKQNSATGEEEKDGEGSLENPWPQKSLELEKTLSAIYYQEKVHQD